MGPNELNAKPPRTLAQMAREQLTDPMILILLVAAVLSAFCRNGPKPASSSPSWW
ncbi:MAG: cation-transporting P-type ATPase [Eggerthella lenta]